jgi:outer membrane protein TolC
VSLARCILLACSLLASSASAQTTLHSWNEARQLLLEHQPSLRQQRAELARAQAGVEQAWSRVLPRMEVAIAAEYSAVRPFLVASDQPARHQLFDARSFVPSANASIAITFSLSALAALDGAEIGVSAERETLGATQHQLIGTLAANVLHALAAQRVAARNRAGLEAAQERMRLTERLVALGKATSLDALRLDRDLSEAQSEVVNSDELLAQARDTLGGALGLRGAASVADEFDPLALSSPAASGCTPLARLDERPDMRAGRERTRQAAAATRAANLAYWPELRLATGYSGSYEDPAAAFVLDRPRDVLHTWNATASLSWTIFDGGLRAADTANAEAERIASRAGLDAAAIASTTEYRAAQRLISVARANLDISQHSLEAARSIDRLSRKALELGSASALEVVDAAKGLRANEITFAVREVELLAAQVRAHMASSVCR